MKERITLEEFTKVFNYLEMREFFTENFGLKTTHRKLMAKFHELKMEREEAWILSQDLGLTKVLIANGANVHARNGNALALAAAFGQLEFVNYFIEQGADVHANNEGALYWAIRDGHLAVVKFLLEKGANLAAVEKSAFYWAERYGCKEVLNFLKSIE